MALVHPDDLSVVLEGSPDAEAALLPMAYEFRIRLPDGSYRWLASRSAPVLDEFGRQVRRVGVNWDITESKSAEMARQHAELAEREIQAKSQFLSRMSHELRLLNAVLAAQLPQLEARKDHHADQLAKLGTSARKTPAPLINDVLDLRPPGRAKSGCRCRRSSGAIVRGYRCCSRSPSGMWCRRRRRRRQRYAPRPTRPGCARC
jgi:hypothetical protein